jgi:hypothetical protein
MIRDLKRLDIKGGPASDGVVTSKLVKISESTGR